MEKGAANADRQEICDLTRRLAAGDEERVDPWWVYEIVQARGVDGLLDDLHERIATLPK